jgi:phage portal protein BeeE
MLLGIPGDATYANYKEANTAFWRQTIVPLVSKASAALAAWLSPWSDEPLLIRPDLDHVPALSAEREAFWARLEATSFLTSQEKRDLAGLGPADLVPNAGDR